MYGRALRWAAADTDDVYKSDPHLEMPSKCFKSKDEQDDVRESTPANLVAVHPEQLPRAYARR